MPVLGIASYAHRLLPDWLGKAHAIAIDMKKSEWLLRGTEYMFLSLSKKKKLQDSDTGFCMASVVFFFFLLFASLSLTVGSCSHCGILDSRHRLGPVAATHL